MSLAPGTTLGPYSVTTKLDRDVALKVLPQAFTDDPDRLAMLEREARVLTLL